jgi:2-methylcitrate dehydratase PrpD
MMKKAAMEPEARLSDFIANFPYDAIPDATLVVVKRVVLTAFATAVAGAGEEGCDLLRESLIARGGRPEATTFVFHDRLPATSAALINGVMCRALDYCDAMAPGIHIGSSLVPAAFAAAELRGGCSGKEFLAALAVGCEVGSRLNLSEAEYDGFDPTGVAGVFAATAAVSRILALDVDKTLHALGLAFNRCGGSFQSNVDGSLAVRLIQGWVAETGVSCALLARDKMTGPHRFLSGIYGYAHLFARGTRTPESFVENIGTQFLLHNIMFKKYPSCGLTQGVTELAIKGAKELHLVPEDIDRIEAAVPPYAYRLVGHDLTLGNNPRVNAQFSIQYCVASAIIRKSALLDHFRESDIRDGQVLNLARRVVVRSEQQMNERGHTSVDLFIRTRDGRELRLGLDIAPGFPGNALGALEHAERFADCMSYAPYRLPKESVDALPRRVDNLQEESDVRGILDLVRMAGRAG